MSPSLQSEQSVRKTVLVARPVVMQRNVAEPRLVGDETKTNELGYL